MSATSPASARPPRGRYDVPAGGADGPEVSAAAAVEVGIGPPGTAGVAVPVPSTVAPAPRTERDAVAGRRVAWRALAAVGGVVASGSLVAVAAAHTQSFLPRDDPAGAGGARGNVRLAVPQPSRRRGHRRAGAHVRLLRRRRRHGRAAVSAGRVGRDRGAARDRAAGPAAGLHRRLQLSGLRADGRDLRRQPVHPRALRDQPGRDLPLRRGPVVLHHGQRVRAGVHGLQLSRWPR